MATGRGRSALPSAEQDIQRAIAAMVQLRLCKGQHPRPVRCLVEPAWRHRAQRAASTERSAGDHQYTAVATRLGTAEEGTEARMRLRLGQAVQVQTGVDRIVASAQLQPGAPVEIDRTRWIKSLGYAHAQARQWGKCWWRQGTWWFRRRRRCLHGGLGHWRFQCRLRVQGGGIAHHMVPQGPFFGRDVA